MRYLCAMLPFAVVAVLSAQAPASRPAGPPPPPPWDAPHLQFDVAVVKANKSAQPLMSGRVMPTSFNVTAITLGGLIQQAYGAARYEVLGGPGWIYSDRFDIAAKPPDTARPDEMMLMLRGLLADRFTLKMHTETREAPVYALMLARSDGKLGPKLSKTTDDCEAILAERRAARAAGAPLPAGPPAPGEKPVCTTTMRPVPGPNGMLLLTLSAGGQPIDLLVSRLASAVNARIVDRTGLTGLYDFEVQFSPMTQRPLTAAPPGGAAAAAPPVDDAPTVFDAVRELGLKLESQRAPAQFLIIDSAEKPTDD